MVKKGPKRAQMDSNHQKKLDIIESNQNVQYETNRVSPVDILAET